MHKVQILIVASVFVTLNIVVALALLFHPAEQEAQVASQETEVFDVDNDVIIDVEENVQPSDPKLEQHVEEVSVYTIPVLEQGAVLDAMYAFAAEEDTFTFSGKTFPGLGLFVEEVGGRRSENGYYWILYINGETSDLGVSSADVSPRDIVEWRYEEGY